MDLNTALENIKNVRPKFAIEEIRCIRENKEEAKPVLLNYIKQPVIDYDGLPDVYDAHNYAMFLLAEFRVKEAFPYLIQYLEADYDTVEWLLGDILTEDFGAILASVATIDDVKRIKKVIQNEELDAFCRASALTSLIILYVEGIYPRKELIDFFGVLLENRDDDYEFLTLLVCDCIDIYAKEHFDKIDSLFEEDLIDEMMIGYADFKRDIASLNEEKAFANLLNDTNKRFITDTVKSMSWWSCFKRNPEKMKAGRNDPCPCGSGEKYKKCCLE